ncbi:MAG: sigma 54-interacting transcriptional regulator, partial [Kofleriaceae bacterium]|nr:sigma 54-interacting transcriptional regulator [Kofleriaceae bacterium]
HLLRALESGLIRPVGGRLEELVNVRVVAATNRSCLSKKSSPLRLDLFHRLSTVVVEIPPLRQRRDDIPLMVRAFLQAGTSEYGRRRVSRDVLEQLAKHEWAGNVRELHNSVNRAMALGASDLTVADFLPNGVIHRANSYAEPISLYNTSSLTGFQQSQRQLLQEAYRKHKTIRAAAEYVGLPKSTFSDLCKRYRIETKKKRR